MAGLEILNDLRDRQGAPHGLVSLAYARGSVRGWAATARERPSRRHEQLHREVD